jgi:flagellin
MFTINTPGFGNSPLLGGLFQLGRVGAALNTSLTRLSTGLAINRGSDNPAGLIASEMLLSNLRGLEAATRNVERADMVLSTADGALGEVGGLLRDLDGLVVQAANTGAMSDGERRALQVQADSILQAVGRIAGTSSFGGQRLLGGQRSFVASDVSARVESIRVHGSDLAGGQSAGVDVAVTRAAERAALAVDLGGETVNLDGQLVLDIEGDAGSGRVVISDGMTLEDVAAAINQRTGTTGVEAEVVDGRVVVRSGEYGSERSVSVRVVNDGGLSGEGVGVYRFVEGEPGTIDEESLVALAEAGSGVRDEGVDIGGMINGIKAAGRGRTMTVNDASLSMSITLDTGPVGAGQANATNTGTLLGAATITGGPVFQISGDLGGAGRVGIGLPDVRPSSLGRVADGAGNRFSLADLGSGGGLNLVSGDLGRAQEAVRAAIGRVATERGRIGAFQANTLGSAHRAIGVAHTNLSAAVSMIRDTDYAFQTAALNRESLLYQSTLHAIGAAMVRPASVIQLLG